MIAWRAFALDSRSLAVFRMAIGAVLCADALLRTRDIALMLSPDGMFPLDALARFEPGPGIWSVATLVDARWWGAAMLAVEGAAGLILALGNATKWATVVAWIVVVSVVRRTVPATNAGDYWLTTLLLWSMFLPLGASWSMDARRAIGRGVGSRPIVVVSAGSVALVLQIAAVYLAAGLAKCNESWWSGDAVAHALSVHDHGTRLGEAVAALPWLARGLTWGTLCLELFGPIVLVAVPLPAVRLAIVVLFIAFHMAVCGTMSVGIFGYVGMAAWLALIPPQAWEWAGLPAAEPMPASAAGCGRWRSRACAACGAVAAAAFLHDVTPWRSLRFPLPAEVAVNVLCLHQQWGMFGSVSRQYQWVYSRAELVDGRVVDVLRRGRPVEEETPTGGFLSLPHHRWHKLFWELPRPTHKVLAPSVAAGLVRHWNESHGPDSQIVALEIRVGRLGKTSADDTLRDVIVAAWPPRDASGAGNLDRWLREAGRDELH
jgi:hypothetical protein